MLTSPEYDLECCDTSENATPLVDNTVHVSPRFSAQFVSVSFAVIAILAFIGNSVTLLAFAVERKLLRKNFNLLILNLTVADLFVAVLDIPFQIVLTLLDYWPFGVVECALLIFCDWGMTFVSIFTLVAISIDRYWAACYLQSYKVHNTRKRTLICIALIWCFLLLTWFPAFIVDRVNVGDRDPRMCYFSIWKNHHYSLFVVIAGYHLPSCLMVFCNVRIYLAVRQARSRIAPALRGPSEQAPKLIELQSKPGGVEERLRDDNTAPATREVDLATISGSVSVAEPNPAPRKTGARGGEKEAKIFRSLSYIVTAYLVLWTPLHILSDVAYYNGALVSADAVNFFSILCYLNSAVNPVLYAASCDVTRHAMRRVLRCKRP